jgi:hypothetical protein
MDSLYKSQGRGRGDVNAPAGCQGASWAGYRAWRMAVLFPVGALVCKANDFGIERAAGQSFLHLLLERVIAKIGKRLRGIVEPHERVAAFRCAALIT